MWAGVTVSYLGIAELLPGLLSRALSAVGTVSYSIYRGSFPILTAFANKAYTLPLLEHSQRNAFLNTALFALPVIIAFASLSYFVIERPFMEWRVRYLTPLPSSGAPQPATPTTG